MNNIFTKRLAMLVILTLVSSVFAQGRSIVVSPKSIIVNPAPSFEVDVFVNKDDSSKPFTMTHDGRPRRIAFQHYSSSGKEE
ncbi:MAG: hypothetical protein AAF267_24575, partial [Deinococcota bacterium]